MAKRTRTGAVYGSKKLLDQDVLTLARERMRHLYTVFDHVCISFSGGKDSTVVLNLAIEAAREMGKLPIRVVHFDEEAVSPDTEAYVRRVSQDPDVALEWYALPIRHRNACSDDEAEWFPWAPEDEYRWCRPKPPEALETITGGFGTYTGLERDDRRYIPDLPGFIFDPVRDGTAVQVLGIRADESMRRRQAVSRRRHDNYIIPEGAVPSGSVMKAYPIYDWTTADVWIAPRELGWDTNHEYAVQAMSGLAPSSQRVAPPFGEQPLRSLHRWKVCYPDLWDKMVERVEGAAAAARYANTELWGMGDRSEVLKPPDKTWQEAIADAIAAHPPEWRKHVAKRVRGFMQIHHHRVPYAPILDDVPHPLTGLSWHFLYRLAVRGDYKERLQPDWELPARNDIEGTKAAISRYEAARARYEEQQRVNRIAENDESQDPAGPLPNEGGAADRDRDVATP